MELTAGQKQGFDAILAHKTAGAPGSLLVINGYAGTGKTTLLGRVLDHVGGGVIIAPTGKAALRIREISGWQASTIHAWLYDASPDEKTGVVQFSRKQVGQFVRPGSGIVFIDEASMVGPDIWEDIKEICEANDMVVVAFGDEFQLPPVQNRGEKPFNLLLIGDNRINMTEVTRQALESPIIRMSMDLRMGKSIDAFSNHGIPYSSNLIKDACQVIQEGGMIICHRNVTRHRLNNEIRAQFGYPVDKVIPGEPLLVLKNNYQAGFFNGEVIRFVKWAKEPSFKEHIYDPYSKKEAKVGFGKAHINDSFTSDLANLTSTELDNMDINKVLVGLEEIQGNCEGIWAAALERSAKDQFGKDYSYLNANFGYTLTAHKAQGSQAPSVLVVLEPSIDIHGYEGRRWTYTSCTRAIKNLMLANL